jgi:hypothetical protein
MSASVEVPKTLLVLIALHELGGEGDLETIAVKAHELFPDQFCWRKYPNLPDKDAVRVHLSEAKKQSFGALVTDKDLRGGGRGKNGARVKMYALTSAGIRKAQEIAATHPSGQVSAAKNPLEYHRLIAPLLESEGFQKFAAGVGIQEVGRDAFLLGFKLFGDTSPLLISGRLARVTSALERVSDPKTREALHRFIEEGRNAFGF